jgi:hypothetical protein
VTTSVEGGGDDGLNNVIISLGYYDSSLVSIALIVVENEHKETSKCAISKIFRLVTWSMS